MNKHLITAGMAAGFLLLATTHPSHAAAEPYRETAKEKPGVFFHPACNNPADQLELAHTKELKNYLRSAGRQYRLLTLFWPNAPEAASAQLAFARNLDRREMPKKAFDEFDRMLELYPQQAPVNTILERELQIARQLMYARKARFLFLPGFFAPERAAPLFQKIIERAPDWSRADEVQYLLARCYQLSKQYELAAPEFMTTQTRFPGSPYAEKAAFGYVLCSIRLAGEARYDENAIAEAFAFAAQFLTRYPNSSYVPRVKEYKNELYEKWARLIFDIADFYEHGDHRNPQAALAQYLRFVGQFPDSAFVPRARARIATLSQNKGDSSHAR